MKAVKITGIRQVDVVESKFDMTLQSDQVKVLIKSVGVCGSDIHYYNEGSIGTQVLNFPWGVGHEGGGQVIEVGDAVTALQPGDRVAIEPTIYCGECVECLNDRRHTCLNQRFLGCPGQAEGCMSEYYILPDFCCEKIPDHLSYQLAAFAEPLSIGLYAYKLSQLYHTNLKVAILGAGPIGLTVLSSCLKNGQTKLSITDLLDYRIDFAKSMGAELACHASEEDKLMKQVEYGYDVVYECCGKQEALDQALRILKPGGKLMFVGIPESQSLSFNMDLMRRKEICVQNVRRQNNCFEEAIEMIEKDPSYYEKLITHNYGYRHAAKAFENVAGYKDGVIKAMINF